MRSIKGILVLLLLLLASASSAGAVVLGWNSSVGATGYFLYYGTSSRTYTTAVDAGPALSASISGLTPSTTYYFGVTAYNETSESSYSNEVAYTVPASGGDTILPTTSITSPAAGNVSRRTNVTISATAADNVGVTRVEFYVNGTLTCPADTVTPYSCVWLVPAAGGNKQYQLQTKAYDAAGNVGVSGIVGVIAQ